jgi:hypothetical protein
MKTIVSGSVLVAAVLALAATAGASSPRDYAKGVGATTTGVSFQFSIHNVTAGLGEAQGKIRIETSTGVTSATATCLWVERLGGTLQAAVSADILSTTDPALAGSDFVSVFLMDGGPNGAGDAFSAIFFPFTNANDSFCFFIQQPPNLVSGDVVLFDQ